MPEETAAVEPTIVTDVTPRSRSNEAFADGRSALLPSRTMTGERWAPAAVAPTMASVGLAFVASVNASRLSACDVPDAPPPLTLSPVGAYREAACATAVASVVVLPTSTTRVGLRRSSSVATEAGMPSGRVRSTEPPWAAAAAMAP